MTARLQLRHVALIACAVALVAGFTAWQLQAAAADDLAAAWAAQQAPVPEDDSPPPDLASYRAILDTLNESIAIRHDIDGLLATVERIVFELESQQKDAASISRLARGELVRIGSVLGGAVDAARSSAARLGRLERRLEVSARLARLIAEELEELDESFGPSGGGR